MAEKRIQYIDIAKGIGILAVVAGHSVLIDSFPQRLIYTFHMPLFFFLAGYCYNPDKYSFATLLRKRIRQLLVPLFIFSAILLAVRIPVLGIPFTWNWFELFPFALWFVFVLFWTEIVGFFTVKRSSALALLIGMVSVILYRLDINLPYSLSCLPAAVMFYSIGCRYSHEMGRLASIKKLVGGGNWWTLCLLTILLLVYSYCYPIRFDMICNAIPTPSIVVAFCGIYTVLHLSQYISRSHSISRILIFLGKNTFVIMAVHQFFMYIATVHIKPILSDGVMEMALYKLIQQAIMWLGVLATIWFVNHKAKWILGK